MAIKDKYFTISQAASYLGMTRQTISRWVSEGKITAEKMGRQKLIPKNLIGDLARYMGEQIGQELIMAVDRFVGLHARNIKIFGDIIAGKQLHAIVVDKKGRTRFIIILIEQTGKERTIKSVKQFIEVDSFNEDTTNDDSMKPRIEIYYCVNDEVRVVEVGLRELSSKYEGDDKEKE